MANFGEINSIKKKKAEEDKDADEDDTNKYYVGGTDGRGGGSGQQVLAPKNKDKDKKEVYRKILEAGKKEGAERPIEEGEEKVEITLYANGFTVNDGPLREKGVALNDEFLDQMAKGQVPPELMKNGETVAVKLNDKSSETKEKPNYTAYSGQGNAIGGTKLDIDSSDVIQFDQSNVNVNVNESGKTIRVQIKFPNGKKLVAKFNLHHTVRDLISVIKKSGMVNENFVLQDMKRNVIPSSALNETLTAAGFANAVVMVNTKL